MPPALLRLQVYSRMKPVKAGEETCLVVASNTSLEAKW